MEVITDFYMKEGELMGQYHCNKCGSERLFIQPKENQTGLYCSDCGAWVKWINKNEKRLFEHNNSVPTETETLPRAIELITTGVQSTIDQMTSDYIVKACVAANIDKDTLIRQQEEINQLRAELNKYKAMEGYFIHGKQVYVKED